MSTFPESFDREERRFAAASATRAMELDRPLGFMTPGERVVAYERAAEPYIRALKSSLLLPRLLRVRQADIAVDGFVTLDAISEPDTPHVTAYRALLTDQIVALRKLYLAGLES